MSPLKLFLSCILVSVFATLSGCHSVPLPPVPVTTIQDRFDGPAGTAVHDFVKASNACQKTTAPVSQDNKAPALPTCGAVIRCLASKGYVSSPSGKFDAEELRVGVTCTAQ